MALKTFRPTTPSTRQLVLIDRSHLHKGRPAKHLTEPQKEYGGRNNPGRITTRWRGGGHKKLYRVIDFKRRKFDAEGRLIASRVLAKHDENYMPKETYDALRRAAESKEPVS